MDKQHNNRERETKKTLNRLDYVRHVPGVSPPSTTTTCLTLKTQTHRMLHKITYISYSPSLPAFQTFCSKLIYKSDKRSHDIGQPVSQGIAIDRMCRLFRTRWSARMFSAARKRLLRCARRRCMATAWRRHNAFVYRYMHVMFCTRATAYSRSSYMNCTLHLNTFMLRIYTIIYVVCFV